MMFVGADIQFEMLDVFVDLPAKNRSWKLVMSGLYWIGNKH
jgi:hypothetical protein